MAELTKQQKMKYLTCKGTKCPFCGSFDIVGEEITVDDEEARQDVSCSVCLASWRDVYELVGLDVICEPAPISVLAKGGSR